jgi:hypothetical protein
MVRNWRLAEKETEGRSVKRKEEGTENRTLGNASEDG